MGKIDNPDVIAAELLFSADLMPGCDDELALGPDGQAYCVRFADHGNYGLDHRSEDGTLW